MSFDARKNIDEAVGWIRQWFEKNGKDCFAVIGISGGKDSTICAALCREALGKDRVIGVLMPNRIQSDIEDSRRVVKLLGIRSYEINIDELYKQLLFAIPITKNYAFETNEPARLRMTVLYGVAACVNGRVVNTTNLSEAFVGYGTLFGDTAGDFSPLGKLTKNEVVLIGDELGLPKELVYKAPSDGMSGKTDEESLGVTYDEIHKFIRNGIFNEKILKLHENSHFKREAIRLPTYEPTFD